MSNSGPTRVDGQLWRAANGRLWLHFDEGPLKPADAMLIVRLLEKEHNATFLSGTFVIDPLGDCWWLKFRIGEAHLTLDWDHWTGLGVVSESTQGDPVVERLHDWFKECPPTLWRGTIEEWPGLEFSAWIREIKEKPATPAVVGGWWQRFWKR